MNITKSNKTQPDLMHQSKSFLVISTNYQLENLYNLLIKNPQLINSKDQKDETFLSYAIKRKNEEQAELIVTSPILDLTYQDTNGNSYLHLAIINQMENIARILVEKGININIINNDGNTALHFAYSTGDIKIISFLIENNAALKIKNNDGLIPEEIETDSFPEILDYNYLNRSNNTNNYSTDSIVNYNEYNNTLVSNDKNKINKSINLECQNNETKNSRNNTNKNTLKYSLVNFTYSDDNDNDNNNNGLNKEEEEKEENRKDKNNINLKLEKPTNDNQQNSDIFDLSSSITYKEKLANISLINSHIVGNPNIISKNVENESDDIVNIKKLKTSENKSLHNSLIDNSNNKNIYKKGAVKIYSERQKNINNFIKSKDNCNSDNKQYFLYDFNTSISKGDKDMINNIEKENNLNNNETNTITYRPDLNQDFVFSPLNTIKEPLKNKKNKDEINNNNTNNNNNFIYSHKNKKLNLGNKQIFKNKNNDINSNNNININNNSNNKNNIVTNINVERNEDSLIQPNPSFLNSKSNMDLTLSAMTSDITVNKSKNAQLNQIEDSLLLFLSDIRLEKYYNILNSNGFEDINLLINKTKLGMGISDIQLKEAGIDIPGDRAKILIRLKEKAGTFVYQVPKNVYYSCNDIDNYEKDYNIKKLNEWLKELKVENYLENFIDAGYHTIELLLMQMETNNPINDDILREEFGISKIGHRARIINKLLEEGKLLNNKLKSSVLIVGNGKTEKNCDCVIY